jgi:integrase
MVDRYIKDVLPSKPKNSSNTKRNLLWWKSKIGTYSLAEVTPALIAQYRDHLLNSNTCRGTKRSPSTVIRYLAALSHAMTIAMKEWGWIDDTPMRKVTKPTAPRGRVRFLDDDERQRLLDVCKKSKSKHLYAIVVLAISTGMRHGEIVSLRWPQVDLKRGKLTLHETKNGEIRSVPLASHALEQIIALSKVRRNDTELLFPGQNAQKPIDTRKPWYTALAKANIDNFRFHDLRHCTASYLAMNGASLTEIAAVLGHKTLSMVKRYSHISDNHTSDVVTRMNNKIFNQEVVNA